MRHFLAALAAAVFAFSGLSAPAFAAPATIIVQSDGVTPVDSVNPFPVTGTITLSLSNYALETGGNLAGAKLDLDALVTAASNPAGILGTNGSSIATTSNPLDTAVRATATGGATSYGLQSAASTNSTNVKNAAGTLYGLNLINTTTTIYYLRMYDSSSAPTCSSATNFSRTWPIPPASASGGAGGVAAKLPEMGVAFANGISFCLTGGPSSTDNTNAATGVFVNLDYK